MELEILTFGQISDIIGKSTFKISYINSTQDLIENLTNEFPELKNIRYITKIIIQ